MEARCECLPDGMRCLALALVYVADVPYTVQRNSFMYPRPRTSMYSCQLSITRTFIDCAREWPTGKSRLPTNGESTLIIRRTGSKTILLLDAYASVFRKHNEFQLHTPYPPFIYTTTRRPISNIATMLSSPSQLFV